jgi:hypothetical protein
MKLSRLLDALILAIVGTAALLQLAGHVVTCVARKVVTRLYKSAGLSLRCRA